MPRYFFHVDDGQDVMHDDEGIDLPDLDAVREEATESAREIMSQSVLAGGPPNGKKFVVTDEAGIVVLEVAFKDAIRSD
ncbi:MAG: hypothetical protein WAO08_12560 [Hyphomicrobiaceae bacterium]